MFTQWAQEWTSQIIPSFIPALLTILTFALMFKAYQRYTHRNAQKVKGSKMGVQVGWLALSLLACIIFILSLPISESTKNQLFSLIGIVLSAGLALSSTTIIGNALSGAMLKDLTPGDFIKTGNFEGRISERGLLHVEIQSEDKNLTVLPNLYLATQPYSVIHSSGTIISCDLSIGYDVDRVQVENALLSAAHSIKLESAFVLITELGDFSIVYRVAGVLSEVKQVLSARSELRKAVIDHLHEEGIEIVSPNFMNTRALPDNKEVIPPTRYRKQQVEQLLDIESIVFDKAEQAESLESMKKKLARVRDGIEKLNALAKEADSDTIEGLNHRIEHLVAVKDRLKKEIEVQESQT